MQRIPGEKGWIQPCILPVNLNFWKYTESGFFSSKNLEIKIKKIKKNG